MKLIQPSLNSLKNVLTPFSKMLVSLQVLLFTIAVAIAQENGNDDVDIRIRTETTETIWYSQWWIWAIILGVFIIVVIAITNRGRR